MKLRRVAQDAPRILSQNTDAQRQEASDARTNGKNTD
jgi:hypothetical protein